MKYIFLFITIFSLSSCSYKEEKEDFNYIPNNTIRFIKDNDTSLLINKDNIYYLLLLGEENTTIEVDYLIKINNKKVNNIRYKEKYILTDNLTINDIIFKLNDKIEIIFNNKMFCIYLSEKDKDNYTNCDFIYLYNPSSDFYITLNDNINILFYHSYTKFNYKFIYELSTTWIDTYSIDSSFYTDLTITKDNFNVSSTKRRGKTIHKKINP